MNEYARAELVAVIRQVRRRWRTKLALRGAVGFLVAGLLAILAIAAALELLPVHARRDLLVPHRSPASLLVGAAVWFFARPLMRQVSDEQVALYLEEHEPSLEATILSAMAERRATGAASPVLVQRLVETAIERAARRRGRRRASSATPLRKFSVAVGAVSRGGPAARSRSARPYLRHALSALFVISRSRRGRGAVPHRGHARQRDRAEGRGSDDHARRSPASTPPTPPSS